MLATDVVAIYQRKDDAQIMAMTIPLFLIVMSYSRLLSLRYQWQEHKGSVYIPIIFYNT